MTAEEHNEKIKNDILKTAKKRKAESKEEEETNSGNKGGSDDGYLKKALEKNRKAAGLKTN